MSVLGWRLSVTDIVTSSLLGVLVLLVAGCAGPPPDQSPPPPPMATAEPPPTTATPDLAGAPPPSEATPAPPPPAANDYSATMAPIPNPDDLPPGERARLYGHRYDGAGAHATQPAPRAAPAYHRHHRHARLSNTHVWAWNARAHRQTRHQAAVHQAAKAPVLRPSQPVPAAHAKAAPVTTGDRLVQLQSALRGPVADGAGFVVSDDLAAGKPGVVTLNLPADLFARVRNEAERAGLGHDARKFDLTATLTGDGYAIAPTGPQSIGAPAPGAPPGQAPAFAWQVQPQAGLPAGPLKADLTAQLKGAGAAQALPLLSLERTVAPVAQPQAAASPDLFNLHLGDVDLPGLGKAPVSSILAVFLLILVVAVLVAAARHTAERERAERRKARASARAALLAEEDAAAHAEAEAAAARAEAARHPELV
jgi:hypothetical protein